MGNEKHLNTRIIHKHDSTENWNKAENFIPKQGEIIIYDDVNKIKIGNNKSNVKTLPFVEGKQGPKGDTGSSGVHIGTEPPAESDQLWIIPTNGPSSGGGNGSGQDGFSPIVETTPTEGGTQVSITDINGPHIFTVKDGKQGPAGKDGQDGQPGSNGAPGKEGPAGKDGQNGTPGKDGISPKITTSAIKNGTKVVINDATGDHIFSIMNGKDGQNGQPGSDGQPGVNGVSPTISTTGVEGGIKVTVTDAQGQHNFTVLNGQPGKDGQNGSPGKDGQNGQPGSNGAPGKTAYQSAQEGGYTDSELQFYKDLAGIQGFAAWLSTY